MTTVTNTERPSTLSERLDPRNWSLVTKLVVVGLVPTVLALSIGAIRVVDQANVAEELGRGSGLVDVHRQIDTLTGALQAERDVAATFVAGNRLGDRAQIDGAQATTDEALRETTAQLDAAEEQEPQLATARRQAETTLGQLPVIRSQVADGPTPAADVTTRYTSIVQRTLALDRALVGRLQTADTAGLTTAIAAGATARESLQLERTVVNGALASGQLDEAQRALMNSAEAAFRTAAGDVALALPQDQAGAFGDFAAGPADTERTALRDQVLATPAGQAPQVDAAAWNAAVDRSTQAVDESTQAAEQAFVGQRNAAAEQAGNTAGLNSVLLMLTLLLTGGIILLLGRQMVRSLRLLRTSALDVAERKLPAAVEGMRSGQAPNALVEPVPLDSRDEIGEVARAFDAVHGQAIRLAADQVALQQNVNSMFVNLSRRSQALVERQLQLIEQLESNEQDPDQLSNLFQLDHLATRMRRNSENLLVLAGTDLAKRNVAPVQVVDVLRAAVSEVEQYQRVVVQTPPNATIAGRAANDLVHLLAELLDNATNFSPPDSQVVMSTTRTADESLLIEISDRGVGMLDAELSDANQRLSGPAEVDVSASRRMGLFVVGRLAARHRIGVRLASAAIGGGSGGLSASVTVPTNLVPSAQLPEPRRDGGPAAFPAPVQQPPQAQLPPAPEPPEPATPRPAPEAGDRRVAVNGAGRGGSLPSMVAGSDGPLTPTFEAGSTVTGGSRNGSAAALPTRRPGSSLRKNAPEAAGDAVNGTEIAPNGAAPTGLQAFAPSPEAPATEGRTPADVFTPIDDTATGGSATGTGDTPAGGGLPPQGPGPDRPGTPPVSTGDDDEPGPDEDPAGAESDATTPEDQDTPERSGVGPAAALGLGGAFAAAAAARSGERDLDDTVVMDAATGDGPPPAAADGDRDGSDSHDGDVHDGDLPGSGLNSSDPNGSDPNGSGQDAGAHDTARDGEETPAAAVAGTGAAAETTLEAAETRGDTADADEATVADSDRSADSRDDSDTTADTAGAAADDTADDTAYGTGGDTRSDAVAAGTADAPAGTGQPTAATPGPDAEGEAEGQNAPAAAAGAAGAAAVPGTAPDIRPGSRPDAGPEAGPEAPDDASTATTSIPTVRPSGREPMGGPPGTRPNGVRPGPSPRPVMPGAALPTRRPSPGPGRGGPAQRPDGPPTHAPNGAPLPKRQVTARGPVDGGPPAGRPGPTQDELFAPKVPVEGDRGQLRRPGALEAARSQNGFDMSQTTPIFDDIASAWFRSNRSVPVRWQDGSPAQADGPAVQPDAPSGQPGTGGGFSSPADDAWRQAREVAGEETGTDDADETTSAGLPKRRPRARLLPGSAAGSTVLSPAPAGESRNAESVRGRLASYQQGVRQGRESASSRQYASRTTTDGTPEPSGDRTNQSDPEENQ
ncbi:MULTISPECIES: nitrate- and nitrite sensing domain-containing protein [Pseudonocardia]|uniref:histidine kinase n=2 Tax=Pseudonocardia TaxID=1847 RepID=A0A1Y2N9U3_PSEAH|nr:MULTISPECIES: nitrate- and nitrite sensing domain-containing protein [Pseudonocardia]OSY43991.1 sensory histidine kinase CreC [Pseudonocardia autotrophica]TDN74276.1 signal transduction histidine kinase [Pseudonocardia autotrophica]BBG05040.1 hypothetical protein Pdca_62490 [Pseudonocardia autotrophica]GEC27971.1 hypothetical protein PSA01_50000 [Pseudonocardia saturnea]